MDAQRPNGIHSYPHPSTSRNRGRDHRGRLRLSGQSVGTSGSVAVSDAFVRRPAAARGGRIERLEAEGPDGRIRGEREVAMVGILELRDDLIRPLHDHRPPPRDLACRAKPRGRVGGGIRRRRATGLPPLRDSQLWVCPGTVRHLRSRFSRGTSLGDCKKPCKGRGVCPSCNGRRMAQTAAHLIDHVIPPVPMRQWVISVPKRLRWFLGFRPEAVSALTNIFMSEVERFVCEAAGVKPTPSPVTSAVSGSGQAAHRSQPRPTARVWSTSRRTSF